jgi:hypothetical protein
LHARVTRLGCTKGLHDGIILPSRGLLRITMRFPRWTSGRGNSVEMQGFLRIHCPWEPNPGETGKWVRVLRVDGLQRAESCRSRCATPSAAAIMLPVAKSYQRIGNPSSSPFVARNVCIGRRRSTRDKNPVVVVQSSRRGDLLRGHDIFTAKHRLVMGVSKICGVHRAPVIGFDI